MATDLGLFASPEDIQRARSMEMAKMNAGQLAGYMGAQGGAALGQGLGKLFGVDVRDETMKRADTVRELAGKYGADTADAFSKMAQEAQQRGDIPLAMKFREQAQQMSSAAFEAQKKKAEALSAQSKVDLETKLRDELSKLPENASEEDILKVVTKYGSADKVLAALQSSQARKEAAQARKEQAAASDATKLEIARMNNETKSFLGQLAASLKTSDKPLSSADLKMVNDARQSLQAADFNVGEASSYIDMIDNKKMHFGMGENMLSTARTAVGRANESDQNKVNLQQWVEKASADVLRMDVGVKTEGDAERAKTQVLSALSKNDANAVKASLKQYIKVLNNAKQIQQDKLNTIAEERNRPNIANVPSRQQGTAENPIVLK